MRTDIEAVVLSNGLDDFWDEIRKGGTSAGFRVQGQQVVLNPEP
jgi:hypothetical protein